MPPISILPIFTRLGMSQPPFWLSVLLLVSLVMNKKAFAWMALPSSDCNPLLGTATRPFHAPQGAGGRSCWSLFIPLCGKLSPWLHLSRAEHTTLGYFYTATYTAGAHCVSSCCTASDSVLQVVSGPESQLNVQR